MPDGIPGAGAAADGPRDARPVELGDARPVEPRDTRPVELGDAPSEEPQDARLLEPAPAAAAWPQEWGAPDDPANVASPWTVPGLAYAADGRVESVGLPDGIGEALMPIRPTYNTLAVLSLFFMVIFPPAGALFGGIAVRQIRRSGERGFAMALVGLLIGTVMTLLLAAVVALAIWLISAFPAPD
jgi:hypothetical protein